MLAAAITGALGLGQSLINNAAAQQNFNEQMAFSKYQYEDMKKYNSMQEQVKRMRAAGINPALAIGQGQLGSTAGSTSIPSAPSFQQADLNPMVSAVTASSQSRLNDAEAEGRIIENSYKGVEHALGISRLLHDIKGLSLKNKSLESEAKMRLWDWLHYDKFQMANLRNVQSETNVNNYTADYMDSLALINTEKLNWLPQEKRAEILLIGSEIFRNYAEGKASGVNAAANRTTAAAAWRNALKQNGIYFNNRDDENAYIQSALDAMEKDSYVSETESKSGSFEAGALTFKGKGSSSRSNTKPQKVRNPYKTGKRTYE